MLKMKGLLFYVPAVFLLLTGQLARSPVLCFAILVILLVLAGRATRWRVVILLTLLFYSCYKNLAIYDNFDSFIVMAITIPVIFKAILGGLK